MIAAIQLVNFQCHRKTRIDLDRLTFITGTSDSGKSAIVRGLRWLVFNRPLGDDYIRNGMKKGEACEVTVTTDDGHTITRRKDRGSVNEYVIDGETFVAFGKGVPKEVERILRLTDLNFQFQFDSPFLIGDTPGNIAKFLNGVCDLSVVDELTKTINTDLHRIQSTVRISQSEADRLDKEVAGLAWLEEAEGLLEGVTDLNTKAEGARKRVESIQTGLALLERHRKQQKALKGAVDPATVRQLLSTVETLHRKREELKTKAGTLTAGMFKLASLKAKLDGLHRFAQKEVEGLLEELADKEADRRELVLRQRNGVACLDRLTKALRNRDALITGIDSLKQEFAGLGLPDTCPTCGQGVEKWEL